MSCDRVLNGGRAPRAVGDDFSPDRCSPMRWFWRFYEQRVLESSLYSMLTKCEMAREIVAREPQFALARVLQLRAIDRSQQDPDLYEQLSDIELNDHRLPEARRAERDAVRYFERDKAIRLEHAFAVFIALKDPDDAISVLDQIDLESGVSWRSYLRRARTKVAGGSSKDALKEARRGEALVPHSDLGEYHASLAALALEQHDVRTALMESKLAVTSTTGIPRLENMLITAKAYLLTSHPVDAIRLADRVSETTPAIELRCAAADVEGDGFLQLNNRALAAKRYIWVTKAKCTNAIQSKALTILQQIGAE